MIEMYVDVHLHKHACALGDEVIDMHECSKLWEKAKLNGEAARFVQAAAAVQKVDPKTYTVEQRSVYVKSLTNQIVRVCSSY